MDAIPRHRVADATPHAVSFAALSPALVEMQRQQVAGLDFIPYGKNWTKVLFGDDELGGFGETNRPRPDMRWKWEGTEGSYGYHVTAADCIASVSALLPAILAAKDRQARRDAECMAMPAHLRALLDAADRAEFASMRAFGRNPFDHAAYLAASERAQLARLAYQQAVSDHIDATVPLLLEDIL